jgi:hypothetical protein
MKLLKRGRRLARRALLPLRMRMERKGRLVIGMPAGHPELLAGAERDAVRPHFLLWTAELLETEQTSGFIIESVRREEGR